MGRGQWGGGEQESAEEPLRMCKMRKLRLGWSGGLDEGGRGSEDGIAEM